MKKSKTYKPVDQQHFDTSVKHHPTIKQLEKLSDVKSIINALVLSGDIDKDKFRVAKEINDAAKYEFRQVKRLMPSDLEAMRNHLLREQQKIRNNLLVLIKEKVFVVDQKITKEQWIKGALVDNYEESIKTSFKIGIIDDLLTDFAYGGDYHKHLEKPRINTGLTEWHGSLGELSQVARDEFYKGEFRTLCYACSVLAEQYTFKNKPIKYKSIYQMAKGLTPTKKNNDNIHLKSN